MDNATIAAEGAHTRWKGTTLQRLNWRQVALPLLAVGVAFAFTGCYDDPYYGGYGYDPYDPYYGSRYVGPGYGPSVVAVRTGPRRGYYRNRARYRNRVAVRRNRSEFRRGREIRRDNSVQRQRGARQIRTEANTPEQ
ncbi:MAG TPA: hypothetical protein VF551_04710 [Chthoniobacterales bacterium]